MRASLRIICIGFALAAALVVLSDAPASSEVIQFNCTYQTFYNGTDHRTPDAQDFKFQFTIDTVSNKAV